MDNLINRNTLLDAMPKDTVLYSFDVRKVILGTPTIDAIPVYVIKDYLQKIIDEWNRLGDRKYELPNIQVYNHVRKCQDDLEKYLERR